MTTHNSLPAKCPRRRDAVRLKKRANVTGPISGTLLITVNGSFQSGESFPGMGFVKLACE
jgi:hypothetical protein